MRKLSCFTLLLAALTGVFSSSIAAWDECCSPYPEPSCDWSMCDGNFKIGADWLYWKMGVDNEGFASRSTTVPAQSTEPTSTVTELIYPHFKYDSGFRAYLGYKLPGNLWEVTAIYTYLDSHSSSGLITAAAPGATSEFINTIFDTLPAPSGTLGQAVNYEVHTQLRFSYLDLDFARTICCGDSFRLRPHIGFRGAWLQQKYKSQFTLTSSSAASINEGFGQIPVHYEGYGLEGGLWGEWLFSWNVSIVGHVGGSLLYSKFRAHVNSSETVTPAGDIATTVFSQTNSYEFHTNTPSFDYFVGLQYENDMGGWHLNAHIGWEQHLFFNMQNQAILLSGNLATQGLTLGLDADF